MGQNVPRKVSVGETGSCVLQGVVLPNLTTVALDDQLEPLGSLWENENALGTDLKFSEHLVCMPGGCAGAV